MSRNRPRPREGSRQPERLHRKTRVSLSLDYCVPFPLAVAGEGYVGPDRFRLSDALVRDLLAFQHWWEDHVDEDHAGDGPGWERWRQEGTELLARLRDELGAGYEVKLN